MSELQLDRPLPAELLRRTSRGLAAYPVYPVFSWPWLHKRTLLVALCTGSFGLLLGLGLWASRQGSAAVWQVPVQFMLAGTAMASVGPLLATMVRQRGLSPARERRAVFVAIGLGVLTCFALDSWVSGVIERSLPPRVHSPPEPGPWLVLNALVLCAIYGLLGGGLALRRYLGEAHGMVALRREQELSALRAHNHALDTKLSMLQAQIEPHFLFNTLASVRALISTDPQLAGTTIELLVDYLRATIPRLRESALDSTLGQQLEICESYLRLMSVRTGRLRYALEVEPSLRARGFPPLLLINLVENALKHGIEPKVGPGQVTIAAQAEEGVLRVSVIDDGVGLREDFGSGLGLGNVREQLKARHGERARFTLSSSAGGGTRATIEIMESVP